MTPQIQGPNSDRVDLDLSSPQARQAVEGWPQTEASLLGSTVVLAGVSRSVPLTSDEAYGQLIDPHLWPTEALERVLSAIESTR